MSIWKELYDIFDKERSRFEKKAADKQSVFDDAIKNGFNFNSIVNTKIKGKDVKGFDEFNKYIGKDTTYLIKNVYSKISSLKKLITENPDKDYSLKLKSLFRFYVLLISHIEGVSLVRNIEQHSTKKLNEE